MRRKPALLPQFATALLLALCLSCGRSEAEVRFSGTPDRIVLQTSDATLAEILAALRSSFDVEVKLSGATARRFTGVYSGSVRRVLSRLLAGEDYVVYSAADGISIRLLGKGEADGAAVPSSLPAAAPGSRLVALRQGRVKRQGD
jgi:hypothetical protein